MLIFSCLIRLLLLLLLCGASQGLQLRRKEAAAALSATGGMQVACTASMAATSMLLFDLCAAARRRHSNIIRPTSISTYTKPVLLHCCLCRCHHLWPVLYPAADPTAGSADRSAAPSATCTGPRVGCVCLHAHGTLKWSHFHTGMHMPTHDTAVLPGTCTTASHYPIRALSPHHIRPELKAEQSLSSIRGSL